MSYDAYRYGAKEKDPAVDILRTVMEDVFGRRINGKDLKSVEIDGGPKAGTMRGWFFGKTRKPRNDTIEAAGRALGYRRVWVKDTKLKKRKKRGKKR